MKKFSMAQILTVASEISCLEDFGEVYEILNYMSGESLYTTQLPRVCREAKPYLLNQFTWLEQASRYVESFAEDGEGILKAVKVLEKQHGKMHKVRPIPMDDHEIVDPIEDARRLGFNGKVIDVDVSADNNENSPYGDIDWK